MENITCNREDLTAVVEEVVKFQSRIDEYNRFFDDLLVMLARRDPEYSSVKHGTDEDSEASSIMHCTWMEAREVLKELKAEKKYSKRLLSENLDLLKNDDATAQSGSD